MRHWQRNVQSICEKCPSIDLEFLTDIENLPVYKWISGEKYNRKKLHGCSDVEARSLSFLKPISDLKIHYCRKHVQRSKYLKQPNDLKPNEILIHVDYSENYKSTTVR